MSPCTVVLAAGLGARYRARAGAQADKLLVPRPGPDGVVRPLLEQVLRTAAQAAPGPRVLLTRPGKPAIEALARRYGFTLHTFDSPGLGASLAHAVGLYPQASGWLVLLGDMPALQPETVAAVAAAMAPGRIAVANGPQGYGHPVGFDQAFGAPLMALSGDQGARRLLVPAVTLAVPVADPGIYLDVDEP